MTHKEENRLLTENVSRVLEKAGIIYEVKNPDTGYIHCRRPSDGALVQYWASTGKIYAYWSHYGDTERGVHSLLTLLKGGGVCYEL